MGDGDRSGDDLMTVQDVRHIHHLAMGPVWPVAPHPNASDSEGPAASANTTSIRRGGYDPAVLAVGAGGTRRVGDARYSPPG